MSGDIPPLPPWPYDFMTCRGTTQDQLLWVGESNVCRCYDRAL